MYEQYRSGGRAYETLNPYNYQAQTGLATTDIPSLGAIPTYEGQAQFVDDYARASLSGNSITDYKNAITTSGLFPSSSQTDIKGK